MVNGEMGQWGSGRMGESKEHSKEEFVVVASLK